jgi:hypothetical protein
MQQTVDFVKPLEPLYEGRSKNSGEPDKGVCFAGFW